MVSDGATMTTSRHVADRRKKMARKIMIEVKRTQYLTVEVSETEGFDVPEDEIDFAEFYASVKMDPSDCIEHVDWDDAESKVEFVKVSIKR